jgi:hypothetical protein
MWADVADISDIRRHPRHPPADVGLTNDIRLYPHENFARMPQHPPADVAADVDVPSRHSPTLAGVAQDFQRMSADVATSADIC